MENFSAVMIGRPVERDLVDDGWTQHIARVNNPVVEPGMDRRRTSRRMVEEFDYAVMEEHRARIEEIVADPAVAEMLKPYYRYLCKRPCFHDEYLAAFNNPNVTLVDCPAGVERDHRARRDRQRHRVRARLHRLRHRLRGRAHAVPAPRRSHHHRPRRHHDGGEVEGRRHQPARHDDARLPEHVHHAGARPAGRHHPQLHAPDGPRRRAHRGHGRDARGARREGVRRDRGGRGRAGPTSSSAPGATTARSWPPARRRG